MSATRRELIEAKRKLYLFLLEKPNEKMTDAEINICYELASDDDIQAILQSHIQDKPTEVEEKEEEGK